MSAKSIVNNAEIQSMLKEKVIDIDNIKEKKGFFYNFILHAQQKVATLSKNIFGDYSYQRRNKFSISNKDKILNFLKQKSFLISSNLQEQNKKNYYGYDPDFFKKKPANLALMRQMVLQGKSQVEAAQDSLERLKSTREYIRGQFLNEAAYQFDRQRYCSIYWGVLVGCFINSTIYKKGRTLRKAALLATTGHVFGQISYHLNLDKYFDSVYLIFEQQAQAFMVQQKKRQKEAPKTFIKNEIQ